jgi:hypothetical protein
MCVNSANKNYRNKCIISTKNLKENNKTGTGTWLAWTRIYGEKLRKLWGGGRKRQLSLTLQKPWLWRLNKQVMSEMRILTVVIGFDSLILSFMTMLWKWLRFGIDDDKQYGLEKLWKSFRSLVEGMMDKTLRNSPYFVIFHYFSSFLYSIHNSPSSLQSNLCHAKIMNLVSFLFFNVTHFRTQSFHLRK